MLYWSFVARCDPRLFPRLQHADYNTGYVPWGPEHWADSREGEVYAKCRIYSLLVSDRVRLGRGDAHTGFGHARSVECISRHRPGELPRSSFPGGASTRSEPSEA